MSDLPAILPEPAFQILPVGTTDERLIDLWLYRKAPLTKQTYRRDITDFLEGAHCTIREVNLDTITTYLDDINALAPATRNRKLMAIKSLLSFAAKTRYVPFNVGAVVSGEKLDDTLALRILSVDQILQIIYGEPHPRNRALLRLLYDTGMRVSEVAGITWEHCIERSDGKVQISVFGKGRKTRQIVLQPSTWQALLSIRSATAKPTDPLFCSRGGGHGHAKKGSPLSARQIETLVRKAAQRVNIEFAVSPHWFRHAHATHAQQRGAPIALVRDTLGHTSIATTGRYSHANPETSSGEYLPI
jgi:site-specific recombinase XerD